MLFDEIRASPPISKSADELVASSAPLSLEELGAALVCHHALASCAEAGRFISLILLLKFLTQVSVLQPLHHRHVREHRLQNTQQDPDIAEFSWEERCLTNGNSTVELGGRQPRGSNGRGRPRYGLPGVC